MNVRVCCPSYRRPYVETLEYIPYCRVYVDGSEYEDYKKANPPDAQIIRCADGIQGNLCRVRNYILKTEFADGADAVLIIDDDMQYIGYWEECKKIKVTAEMLPALIEKYSIMARDMGVYFWGANCNDDKQVYREYSPFATVSYVGGPFQCFLKGNDCWYDERLPLKEDYDMTIQQCNKHRAVLRVNKLFYSCKQSEQPGGCAVYRNTAKEKEQFELLQKKWGSKIVRRDSSGSRYTGKRKAIEDYNPVIRIPIKGV